MSAADYFTIYRNVQRWILKNLDTSAATNMKEMFSNCSGLTNLDVSMFDTWNVINMMSMFAACSSLTSLDISGFATGNVTNMKQMFQSCNGLSSLDVSDLNTRNVTNIENEGIPEYGVPNPYFNIDKAEESYLKAFDIYMKYGDQNQTEDYLVILKALATLYYKQGAFHPYRTWR